MLRRNSRLRQRLGGAGTNFLELAGGAIHRLLPHVQVSAWTEGPRKEPNSVWTSSKRTEVRITLTIGSNSDVHARSLTAIVKRRRVPVVNGSAKAVIDTREHDICRLIAMRVAEVLDRHPAGAGDASIAAIGDAFDEYVVASHIQRHHKLCTSVASVLGALHTLSEQSYENRAITFGCVLVPGHISHPPTARFPADFLRSKKYKSLSDGFRTAYVVSNNGGVHSFVALDRYERNPLTEKHYFPDWAEPIARASREGRCGIALSRQGDILVFDEGTVRFTYRYGKWQYWNHTHLVNLLRDRARAQRVPRDIVGRVVGAIYRATLDVSFRRTGGLFVVLHARGNLPYVVRHGDAIGNIKRSVTDLEFDAVLENHTIQSLPRAVLVELASLDGAVVLDNSGRVLAYGAVLQPRRTGKLRGSEGSRTKAAIGASNYGIAVKVSSDGDISVYHRGKEFIRV